MELWIHGRGGHLKITMAVGDLFSKASLQVLNELKPQGITFQREVLRHTTEQRLCDCGRGVGHGDLLRVSGWI